MIHIQLANLAHVQGISKVCSDGYRATYKKSHSKEYIERIVDEFYHIDRITNEVIHTDQYWGGYFVAIEDGEVIGAGGGGMVSDTEGEIYVLYLDPNRRNEGIGTRILEAITEQQKGYGAKKQWVSVAKGNMKGIPFYEARGFKYVKEQASYGNLFGESYKSIRYCRSI